MGTETSESEYEIRLSKKGCGILEDLSEVLPIVLCDPMKWNLLKNCISITCGYYEDIRRGMPLSGVIILLKYSELYFLYIVTQVVPI